MKFKHLTTIAAAMSMMAVSTAAIAQSAPQPSRENVKGDDEFHGATVVVSLLALSAVIAGTTLALKKGGTPASP